MRNRSTSDGAEVALRDALATSYDICRVTPNLVNFVADRCGDREAAKIIRGSKTAREAWLQGRNGLDVVEEFAVRADAQEWQDALVRLTSRSYSISSSPLVSPREVQVTVSVVRYRSARGSERGGVSSTFLADRATHVPVFLQRSPHFRPPEDGATPMIMVGPGTGVAPFRGFLQERRALGHRGLNWLFFGDQHRSENFLLPRRFGGHGQRRSAQQTRPGVLPRSTGTGSTYSTRCSTTARRLAVARRRRGTSTYAATPAGWRRTSTPR